MSPTWCTDDDLVGYLSERLAWTVSRIQEYAKEPQGVTPQAITAADDLVIEIRAEGGAIVQSTLDTIESLRGEFFELWLPSRTNLTTDVNGARGRIGCIVSIQLQEVCMRMRLPTNVCCAFCSCRPGFRKLKQDRS